MKLMIASDIHGSALYCRQMLEAYRREGADRLLLLGDLLYHGPRNDLPEEYAPKEVIALLAPLKQELLCVRGNCDCEVDQMVLPFPILADYCLLEVNGRTIFATHGHVFHPGNLPPLKEGDILLNGLLSLYEPGLRNPSQGRLRPRVYDLRPEGLSVERPLWPDPYDLNLLTGRCKPAYAVFFLWKIFWNRLRRPPTSMVR